MFKLKFCILSILISSISSATAAVSVDWESTGALSSGETAISTDGTPVYAYNLGSATAYTVNTVVFSGTAPGAVSDLANEGNVLWAPADSGTTANFSSLAGDFGSLMDSASWGVSNAQTTVTLDKLTPGKSYQVQVFSSDTRANRSNALVLDADTANEFSSADTGSATSGAYVTGTFIADATGQAAFTFRYLASAGNANVNAIQVRQLPDPPKGTVIMLSSLGGWLVLCFAFVLRNESKLSRTHK
ncbi:MAG: hypothetical protein ACSHYA_18440 [Opitutaceae bacterium]